MITFYTHLYVDTINQNIVLFREQYGFDAVFFGRGSLYYQMTPKRQNNSMLILKLKSVNIYKNKYAKNKMTTKKINKIFSFCLT